MEYRFADYRLLPAARELWQGERMLPVTRLAFDCIAYLVEHRDRAVGRDELVAALWGRVDVAEARVSELVLRARRTIGDDGQRQYAIRTVPGFGYRWVAETGNVAWPEPVTVSASDDAGADTNATVEAAASDAPQRTLDRPGGADSANARSSDSPLPATPPSRRRSAWKPALLGSVLLLAAALFAGGLRERAQKPAATAARSAALAVLPLEVDGPRDAGWVHLGAMDLIADRLRSAGLAVPPSESVLLALHGADAPAPASEREALARALDVGATVNGKATRAPSNWKIELDANVDGISHRVEAEHVDVIEAARRSADLLLAALGRRAPSGTHESVATEERLQQAQAALLANELATARAILDAVPEPERSGPQVRYRLAQIDFRGGRLDQANAELTRLLNDPAVRADAQLQARVQTLRAKVAFRRTDFAVAERDLDAAIALLEDCRTPRDCADALSTRGATRIGLRRFDEAAADLGRARSLFQEAGDQVGVAQAETNLGLLEAERGRPERALSHLLGATAQFESIGATERVLAVRTATFDVQLMLLRWADALATAQRQWDMRERTSDRNLVLLFGVDRARALTGLGRYHETRALLAELQPLLAGARNTVSRDLHATESELAWREGRYPQAVAAADRALAEWPSDGSDARRAGLVLVRQRAQISDRQRRSTPSMPEPAAEETGADQESAAGLVAAAEQAAHRRYSEAAESAYRAALKRAEATGAPAEVAGVAVSYGPWLIAQGRLDEAGALSGRVAGWAEYDFDCALLQVALYRARGNREAWAAALRQAQTLAGERAIPAELASLPD